MSNWITITEDEVKSRMASAELIAFKGAALPAGKTADGVLAETIAMVVDNVRGYCAQAVKGGHLTALGVTGTVPSRLLLATLNIIRFELATRLPNMESLIDELRQKQHDKDVALLAKAADGRFAIEDPVAEETTVTSPSPSIKARRKQYGRRDQDGI